jgi:uncharacterized RDD family membrane protein YckC
LALLIDYAIGAVFFIAIFIISAIFGAVSSALGALVAVVGYLALALYGLYLAYQTGAAQTLGKRVMGVKVVKTETMQPIGGGMGIVRGIVHFVDSVICYIGWLFPLWDPMRQTLADKIMGTVALKVPQQKFDLRYLTATS